MTSCLILTSVPKEDREHFDISCSDVFWNDLIQHPGKWKIIFDHTSSQVVESWESYFESHSLMQQIIELFEITPVGSQSRIFLVRATGVFATLHHQAKRKASNAKVQIRNTRAMPDWRDVVETVRVQAKHRSAVYTSINRTRKLINANKNELKFSVSDAESGPDTEGRYTFVVTPKNKNTKTHLSYQEAYRLIQQHKKKGTSPPPEVLFEGMPLGSVPERNSLRVFFYGFKKLYEDGKMPTWEEDMYFKEPIRFARDKRADLILPKQVARLEVDWRCDFRDYGIPILEQISLSDALIGQPNYMKQGILHEYYTHDGKQRIDSAYAAEIGFAMPLSKSKSEKQAAQDAIERLEDHKAIHAKRDEEVLSRASTELAIDIHSVDSAWTATNKIIPPRAPSEPSLFLVDSMHPQHPPKRSMELRKVYEKQLEVIQDTDMPYLKNIPFDDPAAAVEMAEAELNSTLEFSADDKPMRFYALNAWLDKWMLFSLKEPGARLRRHEKHYDFSILCDRCKEEIKNTGLWQRGGFPAKDDFFGQMPADEYEEYVENLLEKYSILKFSD